MTMSWIRRSCLCLLLLFPVAAALLSPPRSGLAESDVLNTLEATSDPAMDDTAVNPTVVLRQRTVEWDALLLADEIPERIQLYLFDDCHFTAAMLWSETDGAGGLAWHGYIEDHPDSRIILVEHGNNASALIQVGERRFDLRPSSNGGHVVQEIDGAALPATAPGIGVPDCWGPLPATDFRALAVRSAMGAEASMVVDLVNQERAKHDRPPLAGDSRLASAARDHSRDMSDNNYFSHTSKDGRTVGQRITAAGYTWNRCGENIARGYSSPEAVMLGWMNSEGHRSNILSIDYCDLGVGYAPTGRYWTQNFGRLSGVIACEPSGPAPSEPEDPETGSDGSPRGESTGGSGGCFVESSRHRAPVP
jgi:hypothetical protein